MGLLFVAACGFEVDFDGTNFRCGADGLCPPGYRCEADRCVKGEAPDASDDTGTSADADASAGADASVDAAADADASAGADAGADAPILSVRFSDDFTDGALAGWNPWTNAGCTVAETNGQLELSYAGTGTAYCGANTQQSFDLTNGAVSVEVVEAPLVTAFEAYIILFSGTQRIEMIRNRAGLHMQFLLAGQATASRTVANDATWRFWRIRRQSGTTFWETSPDAATWTVRHSSTTTVDARTMRVELAAGHYTPGPGSPVRVRFDRLTVD
jgi:hypothetical protein